MPTSTSVTNLKINELTEAQYDTAVQQGIIGENELSVITDMTDKVVQVSVLPTASATEENNIYQFVGTTDANYTNGYFYKCVSDGQTPATYSWTRVDVQPSSGGSYLPLSGGTITGEVNIEKATDDGSQMLRLMTGVGGLGFRSYYLEVLTESGGTYSVGARYQFMGSGFAALQGSRVLGEQYNPWSDFYLSGDIVFVDSSYNAHTISLPATTGTMVVADYTSAQQGDVLTLDSNGNAVWQAGGGGGGSSYTAGTGIDITNDVISTDIPMAISSTDSTIPTVTVKAGGTGVIAIGASAKAGSANYGNQSIAIGEGARASSSVGGYNNVAIGGDSFASGNSVAIGASTHSGNLGGVAIGYGIHAGNGGIIIGSDMYASTTGTNSGFDIVLYDPATFTSTMYNVIKKGGEINPDRLASTTGLADGNYRLRCTITNGVPTLSWVAE